MLPAEFIVKPNDYHGIVARITAVAGDSLLRRETERRNFEKAKEFRIEVLKRKRDDFLSQLLERAWAL